MAIFGKKDKDEAYPAFQPERREEPPRPEPAPPPAARRDAQTTTTVGPTIKLKGEILGDEDVNVEGRVEGIVNLTRNLQVGKSGVVEADVRAQSVVVHGRVVGNVIAESKVEIFPTGRLEGNIKCPKISIHEGAHFKGNVDMSGGAQAGAAPEPAAARKILFERKA